MSPTPPKRKPNNPCFASGPTTKHPDWSITDLKSALVGRSHRAVDSMERIQEVLELTRELLEIPKDHQIAIVPGSTTGAFTMGLWSLLGSRGVDVLAWEVFGQRWAVEVQHNLKLKNVRVISAPIGHLSDLSKVHPDHDIVFSWNGTTSGVCVPDGDWIPSNQKGLVFCDAISAIFVDDLPWSKLDVTAFSWQKTLGGEGGCGMIVLSPKAIERLNEFTPPHPIPGILSFKNHHGKVKQGLFIGETPNTISLLCLEDFLNALKWVQQIGGKKALQKRTEDNFSTINAWIENSRWAAFLADNPLHRSQISVCLKFSQPHFQELGKEAQWAYIEGLATLLATEKVAYDIKNHKLSSPSIRLWAGPTVETNDLSMLLPWLDWAYEVTNNQQVVTEDRLEKVL